MLPHRRTWGGDVELDYGCRGLAGHLVHLPVFFLLPCRFEVAHPARHLADDVDRLPVLDQALRRRIDADGPDAGVGIQRVCVAAEARPASSSRPDIFCLMNSPWWQTNL